MKRVIQFEGNADSSTRDLNNWLAKHPGAYLEDIRPLRGEKNGITLFCIVDIPEYANKNGWSDSTLDYLGLKKQKKKSK